MERELQYQVEDTERESASAEEQIILPSDPAAILSSDSAMAERAGEVVTIDPLPAILDKLNKIIFVSFLLFMMGSP